MFYTNFLRLCNSIHKSPSAVAEEIGIKKSTVTRWKQGNSQTPANMQKVADYFGVTVEELTAEKENKPALPQENELDNELIELLTELRPDEVQLLTAYAQGIIAARKNS